jgi:Na+/melibiose symporter-like transporter
MNPRVDPGTGAARSAPPLGLGTRLAYGLGAVAYGVKDNGFAFFLLLFYSQVIGLDARLVGLALTIALVVDAISDPVVGTWSDNLRSRWGRRHPFMYAAALPMAASYFLLWAPPAGMTDGQTFAWLLVLAVLIRTFMTFYEVPSTALTPELTQDYDARAGLLSWRFYFGWTGGNLMSVLMFAAIFPAMATAAYPNGQFNPDSYALYGIIAAGLIFMGIMVSALGTHARIPHLMPPPARRIQSVRQVFAEMFETLSNRSFVALFIAAAFGSVAGGLSAALAFYLNIYFWGFTSEQIAIITLGIFASAVIGSLLAPIVSRAWGKKKGAIRIGLVAFIGSPLPIVLKLLDVLPQDNPGFVYAFVLVAAVIDVGLIITFQILVTAMMADLVEQAEVKTGRRSEGIFFAAASFIRKLVTGLGITMATFLLTAAGLEAGANPADVPEAVTDRLAALYAPTIIALWMAMMAAIAFYRIDRKEHEANLATLAARRAAPAE